MSLTLLLDAVLKGTALLGAAFLLAVILRRQAAAVRHLLWSLALLGVIALPVLSSTLPWRVEILPARGEAVATTQLEAAPPPSRSVEPDKATILTTPLERIETAATTTPVDTWGIRLPSWRSIVSALGILWLAGSSFVLFRLVFGIVTVWWVARHGSRLGDAGWRATLERAALRLGVDQPVRLLINAKAPMPFTTGFLRPLIVVPGDATRWTEERRLTVLLHELAHLRRADFLTHLVAQVACALYWFHPLVWAAARKLRAESERACDDLVLRAGTRPSEYAGHLLDIVRSAGRSWAPAIALPMAQRSEFEGRLLAILEPDVKRHGLTPMAVLAIVVAVSVTALPLAALGPAAPSQADLGGEVTELDRDASDDRDGPEALLDPAVVAGPERAPHMQASDVSSVSLPQSTSAQSHASALAAALTDSDAGVRRAAATSLGELQDTTVIAALMQALRTDTDAEVRRAAAWALGEIADPSALDALAVAARDSDMEVRRAAVHAMGEIEDDRAVEPLSAMLQDDYVEVRRSAVWALGEIESPRAVPAVSRALQNDADAQVRRQAAWALGEIESPAAVDALAAALRDADPQVRRRAAWALGEIEDRRAVAPLSAALSDDDAEVRSTAAWALGEIEDPAAADALGRALADANLEVRRRAVWAMGEINLRQAPPALIAALQDEDAGMRRAAARALGEIEDPAAVPGLTRLINDSDLETQRAAVYALSEIRSPDAYEALVQALQSEDPEVRRWAARALGRSRE